MAGKAIKIDAKKCVACHSCELACAVAHSSEGDLRAAALAGEKPGSRIRVKTVRGKPVPVNCRHCAKAPCIAVCPEEAITRSEDGGPVMLDESLCVACMLCIKECPFGAIFPRSERKQPVLKCDLCREWLASHSEPACVEACPTGALKLPLNEG
jgi:carbon-monoxide dehydrogenase iron sulfur subunit